MIDAYLRRVFGADAPSTTTIAMRNDLHNTVTPAKAVNIEYQEEAPEIRITSLFSYCQG